MTVLAAMGEIGARIIGTGSYLPEKVLTNHDLAKMVDTSDEWIRTRTGISERHIAAPDEPTSALAAVAAVNALEAAGIAPDEIDVIIVGTFTPDKLFPNTACFVQQRIGASNAVCFSLEAACSGFLYGLEVAAALLRSGVFRTALVIGAEKLSNVVNWKDRTTCVLFGDGAGAAVVQACPPEKNAFLGAKLGSDGNYADILHVPAGGTCEPFSPAVLDDETHYLVMAGPEVFKLAVKTMASAAEAALERCGLTIDDLRWLIPHQANIRIISSVAKRLHLPKAKTFVNVMHTGNTSAASIPIALDEAVRGGLIANGDHVLLVAFGGGLTWGATVIRWSC